MAKATNRSEFTVHLRHHQGDGQLYSFGPGEELPDWALERITNPYVLHGETPDPSGASRVRAPRPVPRPAPRPPQPPRPARDSEEGDADDDEDTSLDPSRPPESGVGASREAWAQYASAHGIGVDGNWKREDIIAACKQHGH